jgi:hypothetical protein
MDDYRRFFDESAAGVESVLYEYVRPTPSIDAIVSIILSTCVYDNKNNRVFVKIAYNDDDKRSEYERPDEHTYIIELSERLKQILFSTTEMFMRRSDLECMPELVHYMINDICLHDDDDIQTYGSDELVRASASDIFEYLIPFMIKIDVDEIFEYVDGMHFSIYTYDELNDPKYEPFVADIMGFVEDIWFECENSFDPLKPVD